MNNDRQLLENFQDMLDAVNSLHDLLMQEREILPGRSAEPVKSLALEKQRVVEQIEILGRQQHELFAQLEQTTGTADVEHYLLQIPDADPARAELRTFWKKIKQRLEKCRTLNQANGACIEQLGRHTRRALEIVRGQSRLPCTYGPDGNSAQSPGSRKLVTV